MSNNHFNYFRVKNFKRFKDLEVKDIGQFNLVLGDNNVGKTSLLEAFLNQPSFPHFEGALIQALKFRNLGKVDYSNVFKFFLNNEELLKSQHSMAVYFALGNSEDRVQTIEYVFDFKKSQVSVSQSFAKEKSFQLGEYIESNPPFIPFSYGFANDLVINYSKFVQNDKSLKRRIISELQRIDSALENIEIDISRLDGQPTLIAYFSNSNGTVPIGMLGEGIIKLFRIFIETINNRYSLLMIDEIDAGIHYSRMKEYWKVILQSAKENDVQIFATTHNRECIQYFIEALEELGDEYKEKARSIRLVEHAQTKEIISFTSKLDEMATEFAIGNEVR